MIDTWAKMTGKGVKAIFEAEVVTHKEELYALLRKVEKQREDHVEIVSSIKEAKVIAMAKIENVVRCMETFHKELAEAEVEFNEMERNEAHLDQLEAEARATVKQYDVEC